MLSVVFLLPALVPGRALLPGEYLDSMRPWAFTAPAAQVQAQWNPLLWDGIAQFYPWRAHYSRTVIADGCLPLWNPYQFCGTPFMANAQTAVFYPLSLLFVLFDPARAFGMSAMIHLFLAAVFAFMLGRALGMGRFGATVAGVTFAFSAFMVVWLELPTLVNVATWLPLALYLILRSWHNTGALGAVFAGVALGMAVLAGHLQIASYVMMAAALWWVWLVVSRVRVDGRGAFWRGLYLAAICFVVAFLVASPQLLPTLDFAGNSHRVRAVTGEGYLAYVRGAIPLRQLITLFVPGFLGNPAGRGGYIGGSAADYMEYALYIGIMPLLLAIFGALFAIRQRLAGFFVTLAMLSFLLAVGTPLNWPIYRFVPGTSALGGPNRTIVLFCFAAAMLAGYGAHWFAELAREEYRATRRKLGWRALAVGGAVFAAILIACQFISSASLDALGVSSALVARAAFGQYISFGAMVAASLVVLALYTAGVLQKPLFAALTLLVIVADLFSLGFGFNPSCSLDQVYRDTPLTDWLRTSAPQGRIMPINPSWSLTSTPDVILPPNAATVYGICDTQGYDSLFYKSYKEFVDGRLGLDSSPRENGNMLLMRRYVTDWPKGMADYVLSGRPMQDAGLKQVHASDGVFVYHRTGAPGVGSYLVPSSKGKDSTWVVSRSANQVKVVAETDQPARLVLTEAYYPGWKAFVDVQERPVELADGVFRSVNIEPGDQSVTFRFEPDSYVVGLFLGLIGLSTVGAASTVVVLRRVR